jgi:hypothetical protein
MGHQHRRLIGVARLPPDPLAVRISPVQRLLDGIEGINSMMDSPAGKAELEAIPAARRIVEDFADGRRAHAHILTEHTDRQLGEPLVNLQMEVRNVSTPHELYPDPGPAPFPVQDPDAPPEPTLRKRSG